jgi:SAM-dependent MidA family methyltransferase
MTVAAFMSLSLYDPEFGYYARAPQRSGRAGDFFTSVDVGPIFGELLEIQLAEMAALLKSPIDFVEAGAGNGRLAADIVAAAQRRDPAFCTRIQVHLVEASAAARHGQAERFADLPPRLASSSATLPDSFEGVLLANELLDAFPVHQVVMRDSGLREVYVDLGDSDSSLVMREGPLSTPELEDYLAKLDVTLEPGWRTEINLQAVNWIRDVAHRLRRGFIILIDYGHEARELYSATHGGGTLTSFTKHTVSGPDSAAGRPLWMAHPGEHDLTAHVDFTSVRAAAEHEGLDTLAFLDQTYFLLGLASAETIEEGPTVVDQIRKRLALKTLLMPGGLGSTHKVLIFGKDVGKPTLLGCSFGQRVT